jgi:hypothetical protein
MGLTPTLIEGLEASPAGFSSIYHQTVGFVSSLPWCYSRIVLLGSGILYLMIGR